MILPETIRQYNGIITRRSVEPAPFPGPGDPPSVDPLQERYDIVAINTADVAPILNHLPARRISRGARIVPAEVMDPCTIVRVPKAGGGFTLIVHCYTEGIPFKEACA